MHRNFLAIWLTGLQPTTTTLRVLRHIQLCLVWPYWTHLALPCSLFLKLSKYIWLCTILLKFTYVFMYMYMVWPLNIFSFLTLFLLSCFTESFVYMILVSFYIRKCEIDYFAITSSKMLFTIQFFVRLQKLL